MGKLRERMQADLVLRGYSANTRTQYLLYARLFAKHFMRSPEEMGENEMRAYLLHLIEAHHASPSTIRVVRAALWFLYRTTLGRSVEFERVPVIRREPRRLPQVLSGTEVAALLEAIRSPKYRALLMALYAAGLRVSEGCRLRPEDIDSKRMLIRIQAGKGNRDRYTILSTRLLEQLRDYFRIFRPKGWLFPGRTPESHVSRKSVQRVLQSVLAASGINKHVSPHTLRHYPDCRIIPRRRWCRRAMRGGPRLGRAQDAG